jgi:cardiolipin synthase
MKKILKFLTSRVFLVSMAIALQIIILALFFFYLSSLYVPIFYAFTFLGVIIVIVIINRNNNPHFNLAWIVPILVLPIFGIIFYLLFGRTHLNKKNRSRLMASVDSTKDIIPNSKDTLDTLMHENRHIHREAMYIINSAHTNIFQNTKTLYLSPGSVFFKKLLPELEKAEKFIFLEYFIVNEGKMLSAILDILIRKVKQGVEVRFMYDDIGCINTLPTDFVSRLAEHGIKGLVFNPYKPSLDKFLNYRDHRKFAIIDGKVAFTGGINIADEYINEKERFGFWEDACVMLEGDAVNQITLQFLQMWYFATSDLPDYRSYMTDYKSESDGYVIPFSDEPLTQQLVSENAYINVIDNAKKYVYICTPYLILDNVIASSLIRAAKSGVDVRIITPHIADKKLVFLMTRSNYKDLILGGVKIYEFTPGFMHTKAIVSDDDTAIVGTCNFDYRSFYLHFENSIWMYRTQAVHQAKRAFLKALSQSQEVNWEELEQLPFHKKLMRSILKLFAPLL